MPDLARLPAIMTDIQQPPTSSGVNRQTYASQVKNINLPQLNFPNKQQAIIIDGAENIQPELCLFAIGDLIGPQNIEHAQKIFKNRICLFLKTKQIVDKLVTEHNTLTINDITVRIRRMTNPNLRLIISNVCPSIPHSIVGNELQKYNIKLKSEIHFNRLGVKKEGYQHIFGFKRSVYIEPNLNNNDIPETILFEYENLTYRIFLKIDIICNKCKKWGHLEEKCNDLESTNNITNKPNNDHNINNKNVYNNTNNNASNNTPNNEPTNLQSNNSHNSSDTAINNTSNNTDNNTSNNTANSTHNNLHNKISNESHQDKTKNTENIFNNGPKNTYNNQLEDTTSIGTSQLKTSNPEKASPITPTNLPQNLFSQELNRSQNIQKQTTTEKLQTNTQTVEPNYSINNKQLQPDNSIPEKLKNLSQKEAEQMYEFLGTKLKSTASTKRPAIKSASSNESLSQENTTQKQKQKRHRSLSPNYDLYTKLKEIRNQIQKKPQTYILSYDNLIDFLENSQGHSDILALSENYTDQTDKLINMLQSLHHLAPDTKTKNRITRISKKLQTSTKLKKNQKY